jgi:hypothetical protein
VENWTENHGVKFPRSSASVLFRQLQAKPFFSGGVYRTIEQRRLLFFD